MHSELTRVHLPRSPQPQPLAGKEGDRSSRLTDPSPLCLSYSPQSLFLEDEFQTPVVEHQGADRGGPRDAGQQMRRPEEGGGAEEGGDRQTSPRPGGHGLNPLPQS